MSDSKSKCNCYDFKSVFQGSCTTRLQSTDMRGHLVRLDEVAQISGYGYNGTIFEGLKTEGCEND